ncbi:unnamed protein product [Meloidogyne enterolobii]|uniref:Uncharacterized protein n=2 Tax=Meloidogyne enterolobii TaxID=390850 RepID=A0ACB0ZU08_MELEN
MSSYSCSSSNLWRNRSTLGGRSSVAGLLSSSVISVSLVTAEPPPLPMSIAVAKSKNNFKEVQDVQKTQKLSPSFGNPPGGMFS